jgi:methylenetetrahydrofolate reductase (NADPH)
MLSAGQPLFSFEFFPPKDETAAGALMQTVEQLKTLKPDFVSVTYGAGGSTRAKTLELVARIKHGVGIEAMAHLTCVGHSKAEIRAILKELSDHGIENILALRGDPPKGQATFTPHPDGFHYANELAEEIARTGQFCFGVAGYPEKHPEARTLEADLQSLKRKVDAGAAFVTTQLFFHNGHYFDFVSRARAIGIRVPIVPGLMPVTNYSQVQRFTAQCGATLPSDFARELDAAQADTDAVTRLGIRHAAQQGEELLRKGAPGIHFYTLNKSRATREILEHLRNLRQPPSSGLLHDV